jgi:hypothetical protein
MERLNGEIRDSEKTVRGLKRMDTAILIGYQIYHNYIRAHEGLNGITPAEASGIDRRCKQMDNCDSERYPQYLIIPIMVQAVNMHHETKT